VQKNAVFDGIILVPGLNHIQPDEAACCQACRDHPQCNTWVYCPLMEESSGGLLDTRKGCLDALTVGVMHPLCRLGAPAWLAGYLLS
jgi:hypothetical protein